MRLGGLGQAGIIDLNQDGSLSFPEGLTLADVTLSNGADANATGTGGGNIIVNAQNLTLTAGEFGSSFIQAGIAANSTSTDAQAGDITLNVVENISLNESSILNQVASGGVGDSGGVTISTGNLHLSSGSRVSASTLGTGNAGAVDVTATEDITVEGFAEDGFQSSIKSGVFSNAEGDSGGVTISTGNLHLSSGGFVSASTVGAGNAGAVDISASDIVVEGETEDGFVSSIESAVGSDAEGDSGGVTISTGNLRLSNGGLVSAATFGAGNAGAIDLSATDDIVVEGQAGDGSLSSIDSGVSSDAEGDSGGITISTGSLRLSSGGRVLASTFGTGNAGAVDLSATGDIVVEGQAGDGSSSSIESAVGLDGEGDSEGITISTGNLRLSNGGLIFASTFGAGNAGGIAISTNNLSLTNGGIIDASTSSQGNAGNLIIDAKNSIFVSGIEDGRFGISANAIVESGDSGNIDITTDRLTISNNGIIEASNLGFAGINTDITNIDSFFGTGRPGDITINANRLELDNGAIRTVTQFEGGQSGIINLQVAENITLDNNSFISAQAFENADGGNLNIDARFVIAFPSNGIGNDLVATAERGIGGNIELDAEQLFGLSAGRAIDRQTNSFISNDDNDIDVSGTVDGNLNINLTDIDPLQGTAELPESLVETEQTSLQACRRRDRTAQSGLSVNGKGGVPPTPELPLNSLNITTDNQSDSISNIPAPIQTSEGKIQPARGIEVTKSGTVVLTAYHTNNAGERLIPSKRNCG